MPLLAEAVDLKGKSVLDVGCGTGAWTGAFQSYKPKSLTGIDFSSRMLIKAEDKYKDIDFQLMNAEKMRDFKDNQFDIVTASYVFHGMKIEERSKILLEMKRIASSAVVIHDFYGKTELFIRILEFFERSDYKLFKKNFINEIKKEFEYFKLIDTFHATAFYIGLLN
jgi:ubiquinone/menaquinone biosynthesis C-methylase UbiE